MSANDQAVIRRLLTTPGTWAVAGLSQSRQRTAYGVAQWLHGSLGQRVIPIHPRAEEVFGERGYASLADVPDGEQVSVVDCFVNSARVGAWSMTPSRNGTGSASARSGSSWASSTRPRRTAPAGPASTWSWTPVP